MNDLYKLMQEVLNKANMVSRYNIEHRIPSKEEEDYKASLESFVALGRQVLGDDTLTFEQIRQMVNNFAVEGAKSLLVGSSEETYRKMISEGQIGNYALEKLESVLGLLDFEGNRFYTDAFFAEEREFLARFTPEEIEKFKALQDYLRAIFSDNTTRK